MDQIDRKQTECTADQAKNMDGLSACSSGELRQQKGNHKTRDVHKRHRKATPFDGVCVCFGPGIDRAEDVSRNGRNVEQPHAEKSKPGEDLHGSERSEEHTSELQS